MRAFLRLFLTFVRTHHDVTLYRLPEFFGCTSSLRGGRGKHRVTELGLKVSLHQFSARG
jgi:hypothetical protein